MFQEIKSNSHLQTILPILFYKGPKINYRRETILTEDNDFLDLDWYKINSSKLAIILHGLEGTSEDPYIKHLVQITSELAYDALAVNLRSCSGRANNLLKAYHSGKSEDLKTIIEHISAKYNYREILLLGISVGGNITLKYLGEEGSKLNTIVKQAITFSVPVDLASAADALARPECKIYMRFLLDKLHKKLKIKKKLYPGQINDKNFASIKTFHEYDRLYTAPLNGFIDEQDYWTQASSKPWLTKIQIPTLIVNALDDLFLGPECFPYKEAELNSNITLLTPEYGGHAGFLNLVKLIPLEFESIYEKMILQFLSNKFLANQIQ